MKLKTLEAINCIVILLLAVFCIMLVMSGANAIYPIVTGVVLFVLYALHFVMMQQCMIQPSITVKEFFFKK